MKNITISVINDLTTDQRISRMADTFAKEGYRVLLIGRKLPGSLPFTSEDFRAKRFRMLFLKGPLFYAFYNIRLFFYLLFRRNLAMLVSVDLDTLPANFLVSKFKKIPLLYDSHEYFTEVPELIVRPTVKKIWEGIERKIVPNLPFGIAVSETISKTYEEKYGTEFITIRNVAKSRTPVPDESFRDSFPSAHRIIYQGALNMGRGIEIMIESMQWMEDTILFIAGDGDIRADLQMMVQRMKLTDQVIFPGRIPPAQLFSITSQCDLGLSLEEDLGLNYRYSLPNKIFDYIQARVPVLCSDLPEMAGLVRKYEVGEICRSREPGALAGQMMEMINDKDRQHVWQKNLEHAAAELCWEREEHKLKEVAGRLLKKGEFS